MTLFKPFFIILCLSFILVGNTFSEENFQLEDREPEANTGLYKKSQLSALEFMVVAANPYASEAGFNILQQGGSAIDAAIAVQLVLTLVEPQSSGIGGGAFILHWEEANKHLTTFDGRETAPENITSDLFLTSEGKPIPWREAIVGGRSVGVPGVLAALKKAHEQYGKLPWHKLFIDAISLAEDGFIVSPRLAKLVGLKLNPGMVQLPAIYQYFYPNNKPIQAGEVLKNPALAKVYKSLARQGIKPFYQGWLAQKITQAVQNSPIAPGKLTLKDMNTYQAIERDGVCGMYRVYRVCGMGPPSSGGISVIQILAQLAPFNLSQYTVNTLTSVHLFTQSSRLAFADRNRYIADSDQEIVPVAGLLSDTYLLKRAQQIHLHKDMGRALSGEPDKAPSRQIDNAYEKPSTSHVSIIDAHGNAISMTTSIEMAFGSALMVEGFILNNQLTDFSFVPEKEGALVANRVAPLKRPRSSMAPMMVFNEDGSLKLVIGSPGGSRIINYVAQSLLGILEWDLSAQDAVNLPHVTNRNNVTTLEQSTSIALLKPALEAIGHKVEIKGLNSGLHAIEVDNKGVMHAGVDQRREGLALGR